jgi:hypothetical protein
MNAFNRLPGFVQTPAGRERDVLRLLPRVLVFGTLLLALPSLGARIFFGEGDAVVASSLLQMVDILAISILVLHWTAVLTVAIAAFIVMVMKGPAYVADAYPVEDSWKLLLASRETDRAFIVILMWRTRIPSRIRRARILRTGVSILRAEGLFAKCSGLLWQRMEAEPRWSTMSKASAM